MLTAFLIYASKSNMPEKALHMYKTIHAHSYRSANAAGCYIQHSMPEESGSEPQSDVFCLHSVRFKELSKYTGEIGSTSYMQLDTYTKLVAFGVCLWEQFCPT